MAKETYQALGWDFSEVWGVDDDMPILRNVSVTDDNGQGTPGEGGDTETKKNGEMWGDVNADGKVDVADIATIISIMAAKARHFGALDAWE